MKCQKCGFENPQNSSFCVNCGSPIEKEEPQNNQNYQQYSAPMDSNVRINPVSQHLLNLFNDNLFLVLCILESAKLLFGLSAKKISVVDVLLTIFLWMIYSKCKKGVVDRSSIRCVSGTVFAIYVLQIITFSAIILGGLFTPATMKVFNSTLSSGDLINELKPFMGSNNYLIHIISSVSSIIIAVVCIAVGIIGILVSVIGIKAIHKFVQSIYMSLDIARFSIVNPMNAKNWSFIFAVFSGLSAIGSIIGNNKFAFISNGCNCALLIVLAILIGKYFTIQDNVTNNN